MQAVRRMQDAGLEHPTFFEFLFAMAMKAYDRAGMENIVLETGLGGRLDATSSVEPVACFLSRNLFHCITKIFQDRKSVV